MDDAESIDLGWFESTKLNRVTSSTRRLLQVRVRFKNSKKGLVKQWQTSWMPKWWVKMKFLPEEHE